VGAEDVVTPGVVVDASSSPPTWSINLASASARHSYYEDWAGKEMFVTKDPLETRWTPPHWNQHTIPCRRSGTSAAVHPG